MATSASSYWRLSRTPRYSLLFALPLLVIYELLAFALSGSEMTGVRNGADVLLKSIFISLGGRWGIVVFGVLLVGTGAVLVWRDMRSGGRHLSPRIFLLMLGESIGYALIFGAVISRLTTFVLRAIPATSTSPISQLGLPTQLMVSLGAGIYEELLFRVILVSGLAALARKGFGWSPRAAGVFAVAVGATIFSAFHYVGPYADNFTASSFTFRLIAGIVFSAMYLLRGFGVTAWTHALYDIFLSII